MINSLENLNRPEMNVTMTKSRIENNNHISSDSDDCSVVFSNNKDLENSNTDLENGAIVSQESSEPVLNKLIINLENSNKYYSMLNSELLIDDIIELPEYNKARELLQKIKSGDINNITRLEEFEFKNYLEIQIAKFAPMKIESKFILIIYIMFYSKYHLTYNSKYYYWDGSNIIIPSFKDFHDIMKYYLKINEGTFTKYITWIGFTLNRSGSNYCKILSNQYFSNNVLNLQHINNLFLSKMNLTSKTSNIRQKEKRRISYNEDSDNSNNSTEPQLKKNRKSNNFNELDEEVENLISKTLRLVKTKDEIDDLHFYYKLRDNVVNKINMILEAQLITNITNK